MSLYPHSKRPRIYTPGTRRYNPGTSLEPSPGGSPISIGPIGSSDRGLPPRARIPDEAPEYLLDVRELSVEFATRQGLVRAVDKTSFSVRSGEIVALVGESGCGKSVSVLAILGLLPQRASRVTGQVRFDGVDLLTLSDDEMRDYRGRDIGMVFQEPMTSLIPVLTIGLHVMGPLIAHLDLAS